MNFRNPLALSLLTLLLSTLLTINAAAQLIANPTASLQLEIEGTDGTNGVAVAWNPHKQLYYTVIAGNSSYPLETYNSAGKNVSQHQANSDLRGMWYNEKDKTLQGNCYDSGGFVEIPLDAEKGYAVSYVNITLFPTHQPKVHSVGTFDSKKREVLYFNEGVVTGFNIKKGKPTKTNVVLQLPVKLMSINAYTLIYTGHKHMELGVLDFMNGKVYLFDRKKGTHTATVNLPQGAPLNEFYRFSYANNHVFLYDIEERQWTGYKIFE